MQKENIRKFKTLEEKYEHEIKIVQKELNPYLIEKEGLQLAIKGLQDQINDEKKNYSHHNDGVPFNIDQFIKGNLYKIDLIKKKVDFLDSIIIQLEDQILENFQEMQKYRVMKERRQREDIEEISRKENEFIDEIGTNMVFRR